VSSGQVLARYTTDYPKGGVKGYARWRPDRRTATIRADIEDVLVRYYEYWPLGPRQVGYVLIGSYSYIKSDEHFDKVTYILERGRRANYEVELEDGTSHLWWEAVSDGHKPGPFNTTFSIHPNTSSTSCVDGGRRTPVTRSRASRS
jgi:hypothetical protein